MNFLDTLRHPSFKTTLAQCRALGVITPVRIEHSKLHDAVLAQDLARVETLLSDGIDPNTGTVGGLTPLHIGVRLHALADERHGSRQRIERAAHIIGSLLGVGVPANEMAGTGGRRIRASVEARDQMGRLPSESTDGGRLPDVLKSVLVARAKAGAFLDTSDAHPSRGLHRYPKSPRAHLALATG